MRTNMLIAAGGLAAFGVVSPQLPGLAASDGDETLELVGIQTAEEFFFADPEAPAPGDRFVFHYDFYEPDAVEEGAEVARRTASARSGSGPRCATSSTRSTAEATSRSRRSTPFRGHLPGRRRRCRPSGK